MQAAAPVIYVILFRQWWFSFVQKIHRRNKEGCKFNATHTGCKSSIEGICHDRKSIIVNYILLHRKKHVKKDNTWCCYLLEKTCNHISEWHNKIKMIKWLTWIWCLSHNQILCHSWVINPAFLSMGNPILMPILAAAYLINLSVMTINNAEWILSLKLGINGTIAASRFI